MNDLDTLRPDVAEAVKGADAAFHHEGLFAEPYWQTIRAELLRQAREIADLRESILGLRAMREDIEAELDDAKRMFWCLLRSHNAPMIVSAKAMMAYRRREADLVRQDLPSGDVEFRAVLNKKPDEG